MTIPVILIDSGQPDCGRESVRVRAVLSSGRCGVSPQNGEGCMSEANKPWGKTFPRQKWLGYFSLRLMRNPADCPRLARHFSKQAEAGSFPPGNGIGGII